MPGLFRIRRSVDLHFAHHIRGHAGACIHVHGHTWKFEVELEAAKVDDQGFVVDFGRLKREVLEPCHTMLDHALAIGAKGYAEVESELAALGGKLQATRGQTSGGEPRPDPEPFALNGAELRYPGGMKVVVFPFEPTSERIAEWLAGLASERLADERVRVAVGRVYETMHPVESVAEYWPEG